ncbi:hypothetical protein P170DRAFT_469422 [Aspergillus steynii IBT 23096]|uniref:Uncharacterized protein n=1 Tax=Aspergillus steynii IBT 23096 TaxID=1392250 RepID=A0A2I2GM37_9EURO|nr:uncharacterized protein P170DRAFT_469422 [Aspergillus steynii IBT 23096]PLB53943.1 hypothetical protein P170DRAFT_469422 [Aspergillus steynii IBT 23096]
MPLAPPPHYLSRHVLSLIMDSRAGTRNFFGAPYIHKEITFADQSPSTWIITQKLKEKSIQQSTDEPEHLPSFAVASFICRNRNNPAQEAMMKIWLQLPRIGTEYSSPEERARQATNLLCREAESEWNAFCCLQSSSLDLTPELLAAKRDAQAEVDLLPGGYALYLVFTLIQGIRLGPPLRELSVFWTLDMATREEIRQAFKEGYMSLGRIGISLWRPTLNNLI